GSPETAVRERTAPAAQPALGVEVSPRRSRAWAWIGCLERCIAWTWSHDVEEGEWPGMHTDLGRADGVAREQEVGPMSVEAAKAREREVVSEARRTGRHAGAAAGELQRLVKPRDRSEALVRSFRGRVAFDSSRRIRCRGTPRSSRWARGRCAACWRRSRGR